jgi:hypothetical protein
MRHRCVAFLDRRLSLNPISVLAQAAPLPCCILALACGGASSPFPSGFTSDAAVTDTVSPPTEDAETAGGDDQTSGGDDGAASPDASSSAQGPAADDAYPPMDGTVDASCLLRCRNTCVDLRSDPQNCGGCEAVCPLNSTCKDGMCICDAGQAVCGGQCVDLQNDPLNCGACGRSCPSDASCSASCLVEPSCPAYCNGTCSDPLFDSNNCGSCGHACRPGEHCLGGKCACSSAGCLDAGGEGGGSDASDGAGEAGTD